MWFFQSQSRVDIFDRFFSKYSPVLDLINGDFDFTQTVLLEFLWYKTNVMKNDCSYRKIPK